MFNAIAHKSLNYACLQKKKKRILFEEKPNKIVQFTQIPFDLTRYIFLLAGVTLILSHMQAITCIAHALFNLSIFVAI